MNGFENYQKVLGNTNRIALATATNNNPNVRIVNFCFKPEEPNILYFASDRNNQKVVEFSKNKVISFTSIPEEGIPHIRSSNAIIEKSKQSINEMKDLFISAVPGYEKTIEIIGGKLDVFEIHVKDAVVISGFEMPEKVIF